VGAKKKYVSSGPPNYLVRYVSVISFFFLIGHLDLIGVCLGDDQRT
jgi:hypothetical protein